MKRLIPVIVIVSMLVVGIFSLKDSFSSKIATHAIGKTHGTKASTSAIWGKTQGVYQTKKALEELPAEGLVSQSHRFATDEIHPTQPQQLTSSLTAAQKKSATLATKPLAQILSDSGPSIGSIKILGHRGCDLNTPGWFLSVGTPEQYDFTTSDDGETVFVEPNTSPPTGNFEFNHCADPRDIVGKRVRFTVWVKADGVPPQGTGQFAYARLLGFDDQWQRKLFQDTDIEGTYDWKQISIEAEIDPGLAIFAYGISFRSPGKLWISHPEFGVVE
jgi:hypothetical protein